MAKFSWEKSAENVIAELSEKTEAPKFSESLSATLFLVAGGFLTLLLLPFAWPGSKAALLYEKLRPSFLRKY